MFFVSTMCETKGPVMSQGLLRTWLFAFFVAEQLESFSYLSLSKNLFDFKKLNDLPLSLEKRISAFVTHNDLAQKLAEKKAIYHKNCSSKYNQSRLSRLKCKTEKASAIIDTPRTSRRTVSAKNFTKACFFCDAKNDSEALYECHTLYLDMRVRKIAHEMLNTKSLKKLFEGDMIVIHSFFYKHKTYKHT